MDKLQKEAMQVTKEMLAKFIETRSVSPNNFADVFPSVYKVIYATLQNNAAHDAGQEKE